MPGAADASPPRGLPPSVPPHPAGFPRLLPGRGLLRGPRRPPSLTPVVFSSRLTSIYENELRFLFSDLSTCGSFSIDSGGFPSVQLSVRQGVFLRLFQLLSSFEILRSNLFYLTVGEVETQGGATHPAAARPRSGLLTRALASTRCPVSPSPPPLPSLPVLCLPFSGLWGVRTAAPLQALPAGAPRPRELSPSVTSHPAGRFRFWAEAAGRPSGKEREPGRGKLTEVPEQNNNNVSHSSHNPCCASPSAARAMQASCLRGLWGLSATRDRVRRRVCVHVCVIRNQHASLHPAKRCRPLRWDATVGRAAAQLSSPAQAGGSAWAAPRWGRGLQRRLGAGAHSRPRSFLGLEHVEERLLGLLSLPRPFGGWRSRSSE